VFSTNLRTFKMNSVVLSEYNLEDITAQTIDKDFARSRRIHQCWLIR